MARPRLFDEELAVDAAMRAFWTAGYEGTSTQDLCEATGLGRSSIYNTFGSKRELFERALRRYMTTKNAVMFALLEGDQPAKIKIWALLLKAIDPPPGDPLGCLVVNAVAEVAPHDPEFARTLREDGERRNAALAAVIESGQRAGEIDRSTSASDLAHFVNAAIVGMRIAARGGADRAVLAAIATRTLDSL